MNGILISPKSVSEYKFLNDLLDKLGIQNAHLSESELEDLGMSYLMKKVDRSRKVSRESVMRKLRLK
jgi:hypothetical protein